MIWILAAFVSPLLHGLANVLDNYLANKLFKNLSTLIFYSSFLNVIFVPFIFLIQVPDFPPMHLLPLFLIIGLIEVLYLFPYYKALQSADTSIITALFSLGRIFVPVLAFLMVGEVLELSQYVGFLMIIVGSAAATFNHQGKFRFDSSFGLMIICSIMLAVEAVIYKYLFENVSWSTGFVWPVIISFVIALFFMCIPRIRRDIIENIQTFKRNFPVFVSEEILTFAGSGAAVYAISLAPVTLVKGIASFQALFVLIYAIVLHRFFPHIFRENIDRKNIIRKVILFLIMIGGVILAIK